MSGHGASRRSAQVTIALLLVGLAIAAVASLGVGRYDIPVARVIAILVVPFSPPDIAITPTEANVVFTVRMPRILLAVLTGAGLALSGAALQGVFRNPLVGPQVVGVSSGAAFGSKLAILFSFPRYGLLGSAFTFGLSALVLVYALNGIVARRNILALVLAGVVVTGFLGALVSLLEYLADTEDKLPAMVFWLLGSFATANWDKLLLVAAPARPHRLSGVEGRVQGQSRDRCESPARIGDGRCLRCAGGHHELRRLRKPANPDAVWHWPRRRSAASWYYAGA